MKRRNFLTAGLLTLSSMMMAKSWLVAKMEKFQLSIKGRIVKAHENRFFGKSTSANAVFGRCMISSADTDNQLYISSSTAKSYLTKDGPPLHIHHLDDEIFYVVSGKFLVQLEEEVFLVEKGDTIFCPKGVPHTYANFIENNPGEMLTIHQPISPDLEKFYEIFCEIGYMDMKQIEARIAPEIIKKLMENNPYVGSRIDIPSALKKLKIKL